LKTPLIFRVFKNNQIHTVKQFVDRDQIIFGHAADDHSTVDINLDSTEVSAIHCLVEKRGPQYYLCDLGSAQGTFKNGQSVLDEPLTAGDEFMVGPFKVVFFVGAPVQRPTEPQSISADDAVALAATAASAKPTEPPAAAPQPPAASTPASNPVSTQTSSASKPAPAQANSQSTSQSQAKPTPNAAPKAAQNATQNPTVKPEPIAPVAVVIPEKPIESPSARPHIQTSFISQKPNSDKSQKIFSKSGKGEKTFAPRSSAKKLNEIIRPGQGGAVEVVVAWRERILNTYHFAPKGRYKIGAGQEIQIPDGTLPKNFVLVDCSSAGVIVRLTPEMKCEVHGVDNVRVVKDAQYKLEQHEVLFLELNNGMQLAVRFAPRTAAVPLDSPLIFSSSEFTGILAALIIATLTSLIVSVMIPKEKPVDEEIQRVAQIVFTKPPVVIPPPPPPPPPPQKVEAKPPEPEKKPEPPKKITMDEKKQEQQSKGDPNKPDTKAQQAQQAGRANEVKPKDSKLKAKIFTSTKQGGAIKTGDKAGANAQSKDPDPTNAGLLSAFGSGGARSKLDKAYSGSGELLGAGEKATGSSGFNEDRAGSDLGSKFKDTGAGGKGTATQGIAGIGTKGRGTGMSAYGSGTGFGSKDSVSVSPGGSEEAFVGTIDREAVRRAIRNSIQLIKACYDREYRKDTRLEGKVVVRFEIHERGVARNSSVDSGGSTLKNASVQDCVRRRILEIRFPEPPAGTVAEISYPFSFTGQQ